jgi:imidazolonepropionase-like amidohydrolase
MKSRAVGQVIAGLLSAVVGGSAVIAAPDTAAEEPTRVLFTNVKVFDGKSESLITGQDVLIEGRLIKQIGSGLSARGATVIDGGGRTLMPGLIDCHSHLNINGAHGLGSTEAEQTWQDIATVAVAKARVFLEEGFTTVRDMGGMAAGLQRQIDAGFVDGPRIYPSGAFIGPPGGHGDFRNYTMPQTPGVSQTERLGIAYLVNGPDDVTAAARQNFMQGATQIKLMQTGGVASLFDPWQLNGLNEDEIRAAVQVADNYGSYVGAHSYSKDSILRAVELGVKTIEHGFMFDGDIAKLMEEKGAYLVTQMTSQAPGLADDPALQDPRTAFKLKTAQAAFKDYVANVKKYKPKFGFQVDAVGGPDATRKQVAYEKYLHAEFFGNHHMLKAATSTAAEIVFLSGMVLNPYKEGPLGVVEEGAYADLLLVDGNPLEDITVIGAVDRWQDAPARDGVETIRVIMKDGRFFKNTLADGR